MSLTEDETLWVWKMGEVLGFGRVTWRDFPRTFQNPACMIEAIMGAAPNDHESWRRGMTSEKAQASLWAHAGWWDEEYRR